MSETHLSQEEVYECADGRGGEDASRHLDRCFGCRRRLADAEALLSSLSALPREIQPPEWVWSGLAQSVAEEDKDHRASRSPARDLRKGRTRAGRTPRSMLGRAAAVLVLASASVVGLHVYRTSGRDVPPALVAAAQDGASSFEASLRSYQATDATLSDLFDQRAAALPPDTRQELARSLEELDRAIEGVREALAAYPDQEQLRSRLSRTYQWKIKLLERALRMTTEL